MKEILRTEIKSSLLKYDKVCLVVFYNSCQNCTKNKMKQSYQWCKNIIEPLCEKMEYEPLLMVRTKTVEKLLNLPLEPVFFRVLLFNKTEEINRTTLFNENQFYNYMMKIEKDQTYRDPYDRATFLVELGKYMNTVDVDWDSLDNDSQVEKAIFIRDSFRMSYYKSNN